IAILRRRSLSHGCANPGRPYIGRIGVRQLGRLWRSSEAAVIRRGWRRDDDHRRRPPTSTPPSLASLTNFYSHGHQLTVVVSALLAIPMAQLPQISRAQRRRACCRPAQELASNRAITAPTLT